MLSDTCREAYELIEEFANCWLCADDSPEFCVHCGLSVGHSNNCIIMRAETWLVNNPTFGEEDS